MSDLTDSNRVDVLVLDRLSLNVIARLLSQLVANGLLDASERVALRKLRAALALSEPLGTRYAAAVFAYSVLTEPQMGRTFPEHVRENTAAFCRMYELVRAQCPEIAQQAETLDVPVTK